MLLIRKKQNLQYRWLNVVVFLLVQLPLFPPGIILTNASFATIRTIWNLLRLLTFGVSFFVFVNYRFNSIKKIPDIFLFLLIYYGTLTLSTLFGSKDFFDLLSNALSVFSIAFFLTGLSGKSREEFLFASCLILITYTIINLITVLLYPNGIWVSQGEAFFFLGHNNNAARFLVPGVVFCAYLDLRKKDKISNFTRVLSILALTTVILTWSNTGMVGCFIVLLFVFFYRIWPPFCTARNYFLLSWLVFFLFVVFQRSEWFKLVLVNVFHKDYSLSNRILMWDMAFNYWKGHWLLGSGYLTDYSAVIQIGDYVPSSCHNFYLDALVRGGIINLIALSALILYVCIQLDRNRDQGAFRCLAVGLLATFIMWNFETYLFDGTVPLFLLMLLSVQAKRKKEKENDITGIFNKFRRKE